MINLNIIELFINNKHFIAPKVGQSKKTPNLLKCFVDLNIAIMSRQQSHILCNEFCFRSWMLLYNKYSNILWSQVFQLCQECKLTILSYALFFNSSPLI